jgi:hypothetical protein
MFKAIFNCAYRVVISIYGLLSAASSSLGILKQLGLEVIPLPSWVWALAAFAFLFAAACKIEWELEQERNKNPQPDISLHEVVARIIGPYDLIGSQSDADRIQLALDEVRDRANLGLVTVWGRREDASKYESKNPRDIVPKNFWTDYPIDYISFVKRLPPRIGPTNRRGEAFFHLQLNETQVDKVWPKKEKLVWRLPWKKIDPRIAK